jgi:hypothetical protein
LTYILTDRFFPSFPLEFDTTSDEWEDIDGEIDDLDDDSSDDEHIIDSANDLINDEEICSSDNDDDDQTVRDGTINAESDDDYIEIQLSTLTLNDRNLSSMDHFQLLTNVFQLMGKTRSVIKFLRNHSVTNDYILKSMLSQNGGKTTGGLVLDMIIRWNSSFLLLNRLFLHKDILNGMFAFPNSVPDLSDEQRTRLQELILTQSEWKLLEYLKHVLEPFSEATLVLLGQTYPTMDLGFYVYQLLSFFLESTDKDHPVIARLKESLRYWFNIQCKVKLTHGQMDLMMVRFF